MQGEGIGGAGANWVAADPCSRGLPLGATSGRTTLGGEGLQHQDGSSHPVAATIPDCMAFVPAIAGEMAAIADHGMREMLVEQKGRFLLRQTDERELRAARFTRRRRSRCGLLMLQIY